MRLYTQPYNNSETALGYRSQALVGRGLATAKASGGSTEYHADEGKNGSFRQAGSGGITGFAGFLGSRVFCLR